MLATRRSIIRRYSLVQNLPRHIERQSNKDPVMGSSKIKKIKNIKTLGN